MKKLRDMVELMRWTVQIIKRDLLLNISNLSWRYENDIQRSKENFTFRHNSDYGGFSEHDAGLEAVNQACLLACEAFDKLIEKEGGQ